MAVNFFSLMEVGLGQIAKSLSDQDKSFLSEAASLDVRSGVRHEDQLL